MTITVSLHYVSEANASRCVDDIWTVKLIDAEHSQINIFCTEAQARAVAAAFTPTAASLATMQPLLDTLAKAGA